MSLNASEPQDSVTQAAAPICPLCHGMDSHLFHRDKRRAYFQCRRCQLVSVPAGYHLSAAEEKAEYDKHDNWLDDPGYRRFLARTLNPLLTRLSPGARGLDFGCGEGAVLSRMAQEAGFEMSNYDLYYARNDALLERSYDFVTLTEVIEHVADAAALLTLLDGLLARGGVLAVMTKRVLSQEAFGRWHYKNDPTHINFYSVASFEWLAAQLGWRLEIVEADVVFLHKPG
ncbi:class I SAM-dependent methyltransferase [Shewanella sp. AS16]|uniref:class I SAM-dependent methyltransferase n=1 Tax=Shewanella sp. AS16 TaxID=2907625 RepID=UPI001F286507|nr:class I SAM-dependent methyltransferase [Shewanella sp. AS16]MCE9686067.1 class I SAM-dependent methyltransferase [Shewanella sp. AS16]